LTSTRRSAYDPGLIAFEGSRGDRETSHRAVGQGGPTLEWLKTLEQVLTIHVAHESHTLSTAEGR